MAEPEIIEALPPVDEVTTLRNENAELRDQLAAAEKENRLLWLGYHGAGGLAMLIALGPGLVKAARSWFAKVGTEPDPLPRRESADLLAAILRRVLAIGALGLIVAGIPAFLLWRQNQLIGDQNRYFREQNAQIREQLDAQAADTRIVRRAQLLNTIYELQDCDRTELRFDDPCPPKASTRLRQEAVISLAQLDGETTDVSAADLAGLDFSGIDLDGATLRRTNLFNAKLTGSRLAGADLSQAHLGFAQLQKADLRAATFHEADLDNARLDGADLSNADFQDGHLLYASFAEATLDGARFDGAHLYGASFSRARGVSVEAISQACGDVDTKLPDHVEHPAHFLGRPFSHDKDPRHAGCP